MKFLNMEETGSSEMSVPFCRTTESHTICYPQNRIFIHTPDHICNYFEFCLCVLVLLVLPQNSLLKE
jgi:hypothetical protein